MKVKLNTNRLYHCTLYMLPTCTSPSLYRGPKALSGRAVVAMVSVSREEHLISPHVLVRPQPLRTSLQVHLRRIVSFHSN